MSAASRPYVVITGAAGNIGSALARALSHDYAVIGLDRNGAGHSFPSIAVDLGSDDSVRAALVELRSRFGSRIASVVHLAAYFDFSGEDSPLYEQVNVAGTRRLLAGLQAFEVEQFVYSGTMLVHAPVEPGERIDEDTPIAPKWAYPRSKAAAEEIVLRSRGPIPCVLLHLAGMYDELTSVPTLAHQIARVYRRDVESHLYSGDTRAGQSMVHREDLIDAFKRCVDRRHELPPQTVLLIGEPDPLGYDELQDELGRLIHGEAQWTTIAIPKAIAAAGASVQRGLEPLIPDALDRGEKPFVRPFMIAMADDHYALDIGRARKLLGWEPRYRLRDVLARMVQTLKHDPLAWHEANRVPPPEWLEDAARAGEDAEALRMRHENGVRESHRAYIWAHFFNIVMGSWLIAAPSAIELDSALLARSDMIAGTALVVCAALALSWRMPWARWACAAIGVWVMSAPILFWAPTAAGYLNDTLVGALVVALAVLTPPEIGVSPLAATTGPETPPGWSYNPSAWTQRLPIVALALVGLYVSRYLAAYQLGHIDAVWDPFFRGGPDPRNGTEEIITSSVSQAWPVSDAAVGALTYLLEILTGVIGSSRRWRTMPWLVLLFGMMIAPLGVVSIFFIVIQPIWIGTWCTLCLIGAAAMLVQIPYSLDELLATLQFLKRRKHAGESVLRVFLTGDTDQGTAEHPAPEFDRSPRQVAAAMFGGGVNLPWNLAASIAIGAWLMCTRLTLGAGGSMANADHVIGSLVLCVSAIACAEIARPVRYLNVLLGIALLATPFAFGATAAQTAASVACGLALTGLALRRGRVHARYGDWNRWLV